MSSDKVQPIIIKKKKGGHAAHGGAWKIAYADFVTAMMAFFLLMWLLGSTTKGELMGIAEYFQAPLKVAFSGGSGSGDSTSFLKGGGADITRTAGQVKNGNIKERQKKINHRASDLELDLPQKDTLNEPKKGTQSQNQKDQADKQGLVQLQDKIKDMINLSSSLSAFKNQLLLELTDEGLRIQIIDTANRPMFDISSSTLKPYAIDILKSLAQELEGVDNYITLSGHTDATPYKNGQTGYSNWDLSADRANAARRALLQGGFHDDKILRVIGHGSSALFNPNDPMDPVNRRISIVVLKQTEAEKTFRESQTIHVSNEGDSSSSNLTIH